MEFVLFGLTLLGVAIFHGHTLKVGLIGLSLITLYKLFFADFGGADGLSGLGHHLFHEWVTLANLFCLLMGFAILARHFEKSHLPLFLPKYLPSGWLGAFMLLALIFVLSAFLDNIAAALIGGAMAHQLFKARVHIAYLAAIVAASNAGGSGSVVGDTTTTMIWISGVSPLQVIHAYLGAVIALFMFGIPAAIIQHRFSPLLHGNGREVRVDVSRIAIVVAILITAVAVNVYTNLVMPSKVDSFPFMGIAIWIVIVLSVFIKRPDWQVLPEASKGTIFLLSLVLCASMMPVATLPSPTWASALGLGFISAVFDNIPLTALAIKQGGYDWGVLAYAVGFGGSMMWFGSSAGVALSNMYPEMKTVTGWLRHAWYLIPAYMMGFAVILLTTGWRPS